MPDPLLAELVERIVRAGVAITSAALAEATPGMDLTFPQWRALLVVGDDPNGVTVSQVAGRIGVTIPATSRQLRRMERRRLVAIERDTMDRRVTRARLTPFGRSVREEILAFRRRRIADAAAIIEPSDVTLLELAVVAEALDTDR